MTREQPNRPLISLVILPFILLFTLILSVAAAPVERTAVPRQIITHPANNPTTTAFDWQIIGEQPFANFGTSVAYVGDLNNDGYADAVIGADAFDDEFSNQGQIFIHFGSPFGLNFYFNVSITLVAENAAYGYAIAPAGDINNDGYADFLVGAPGWQSDQGLVFIEFGGPSGIAGGIALFGQQPGERFGTAVAAGDVNGDGFPDVIVGAPGHAGQAGPEAGAVYLFYGGPNGLPQQPDWVFLSDMPGSHLGFALAVGDFNDDGYADIVVGAPQYDADLTQNGAVFLFYGSPQGLPGSFATPADANWAAFGQGDFAHFGAALAADGSVNGDSFADLLVGSPGYGNLPVNSSTGWGAVYGYWGSEIGLNNWYDWFATEYQMGSLFGASVAIVGDLDQDGYDDVLVGSPLAYYYGSMPDRSETGESGPAGVAYFYRGGESGPFYYWDVALSNEVIDSQFGYALSGGDSNSDGYADLLIGAPRYLLNGQPYGAAYSYLGGGELVGLTAVNDGPTILGQPTTFSASVESGALPQFNWYFGDDNYASGQTVQHTYDQPGVYIATVYAYNPLNNLTASTTVVVNVGSIIDPDAGGVLEFFAPTGWGIRVEVPGGAVEQPVGLTFTPLNPDEIEEPLPPNASTYFFDLEAAFLPPPTVYLPLVLNGAGEEDDDGITAVVAPATLAPTATQEEFPFLLPITIRLTYTDDQIIGLDENTLLLTYWDGSQWLDAATTCPNPFPYDRDPANNQLSLQICHLTRFGMVGN